MSSLACQCCEPGNGEWFRWGVIALDVAKAIQLVNTIARPTRVIAYDPNDDMVAIDDNHVEIDWPTRENDTFCSQEPVSVCSKCEGPLCPVHEELCSCGLSFHEQCLSEHLEANPGHRSIYEGLRGPIQGKE